MKADITWTNLIKYPKASVNVRIAHQKLQHTINTLLCAVEPNTDADFTAHRKKYLSRQTKMLHLAIYH